MIEIDVHLSVNASPTEKEKLNIPREAIDEFLGSGFSENMFSGKVLFECLPRSVDPSYMEIIINLKDIAETMIAWGTIIKVIIKFCKKCTGYEHSLIIKKKENNKEFEINIPLCPDYDNEKLIKEIRKILNTESKKNSSKK